MFDKRTKIIFLSVWFCIVTVVAAGPYTEGGISGYIGDDLRHADPVDSDAVTNPIFRGWATGVQSYVPTPDVWPMWMDSSCALGPATGDHFDIVSLGDLSQSQIGQGLDPGQITLSFSVPIFDGKGYDFVVFENGLIAEGDVGESGTIEGGLFAELGYVEVSSDNVYFACFPTVSLTGLPGGPYMYLSVDISDIYNFAGKHPNSYGICIGTGFDLSEIANDPNVVAGFVDTNNINYIRIVDVPGSGDYQDRAVEFVDANSWPEYFNYDSNHVVYDSWLTYESSGFDLEAIGIVHEQEYSADINFDGVVDDFDLRAFVSSWLSYFGQDNWVGRCDLAEPKDMVVNMRDFAVFAGQWQDVEQWCGE
ncbi:hypothetical protein ACFL3G_12910 [Planctomycetota bacterium]